jgi:acyl-CoA reductase-like NAD-dependent aldehyde dehydrogenase
MSSTFEIKPAKMFIGGEWQDAVSGRTYDTWNPATEQVITQVPEGGAEDVDRAVTAARTAFEGKAWKGMPAKERGRLLWKIADRLLERADEVAYVETLDNGKPVFESRYADLNAVVDCLQYFAGWATKVTGDTIPVGPNSFNYTLREPLGVVGAIVPWNFPLMLAAWKIAPALATGNTIVVKPASITSLSMLKFAEIAQECGLPPGVLNVVTGPGGAVGNAMVAHKGIDKIAFTGATDTGIGIMRRAAESVKKVSLELGGKSPNIVFDDADLDAAVRGATIGIFYGKGEVCAAGSRLLVQSGIYDQLMEKLIERSRKTVCMDPLNPKSRLGSLVSEGQLKSVHGYVEVGRQEGAEVVAGGKRADIGTGKGYFYEATVLANVKNSMRVAQEEIFGPVLSVIRFDDVEEGIKIANDTPYGLASAIWTRDIKKAHKVVRELKAGTVWVNTYNTYDASMPFGGYKASGFGREQGEAALEGYTQHKSVWVDLS